MGLALEVERAELFLQGSVGVLLFVYLALKIIWKRCFYKRSDTVNKGDFSVLYIVSSQRQRIYGGFHQWFKSKKSLFCSFYYQVSTIQFRFTCNKYNKIVHNIPNLYLLWLAVLSYSEGMACGGAEFRGSGCLRNSHLGDPGPYLQDWHVVLPMGHCFWEVGIL